MRTRTVKTTLKTTLKTRRPALSRLAHATAISLGLMAAGNASAATCTWNTTNGNWAALANWLACTTGNGNPSGVPGSSDTAVIGSSGVVTVNTSQSVFQLNNAGQVNVDAFVLSLGGGASTNSGTLNIGTASVTGALNFSGGSLDNTGGTVNIRNGSVFNQFNGTISGGTINTTGSGALVVFGSSGNVLNNVTLNGNLDLASNSGSERITNNLVLNGNAAINNNSLLSFEGTNTLSGTATITFGNTGSSNRLGIDNSGTLTTAAGTLIHGQNGTIGQAVNFGGGSTLNNGGKVSADVAGGVINNVTTLTNNSGQLAAENGGTLYLSGRVVQSAAGTALAVGSGSSIVHNGVQITGGTIGSSGGGSFVAANSGSNFLTGVTLTGLLDMASSTGSERITGGMTLAAGSNIAVNSNSVLSFEGNNTLTGSGAVTLGGTGASNRIGIDNNGTLTVDTNVLIHGQNGTIGQAIYIGGGSTLINKGTISADVAGGTINIVANTVNQGTLSASNGGTLLLSSSVNGAVGSSISAGAGSTVVQNGVTVSGVINTSGSGTFVASNSSANYLDGVTLNGVLDMAGATGSQRVINNLALNGSINVNSNSVLSFEGNNTLSGSAVITLGDTGSSNRIGIDNNGTLTTSAGTLIHGKNGTIGQGIYAGGNNSLVNQGTISADVAGGTINIVAGTTNQGTLSASNGGTLLLSNNVIGLAGSSISAGAGSTVVQNGVTVSGVINTSGSGTFVASNSGANVLNGVTLNGALDLASATASERVVNNLVLNGNINLNANSILNFEGSNTLSGNAVITLGDTGSSNRIGIDNNGTLTTNAGTLIHGKNGTIGQGIYFGGNSALVNNGTISADVAGGSINIVAATTNGGTLSALNGGQLVLSANVTGLPSGSIVAGAGSQVLQNSVTVSGTINTTGSGLFTATNSGANVLNGVTLNGALDLASATASERVLNNLVLNGNINLNANSILNFEGSNTLSGSAVITLGDTGSSNRIGIDNNGTLTTNAGTLIHGKNGTIGQAIYIGGNSTLVNNGTISADVGGGSVNIVAATTNGGTLSALNGGQLVLSANVTGLPSGSIVAGSGSQVLQNGVTVSGTINTTGSGLFTATNSGSNVFNGVTLNGALDLASATASERVVNNLVLNGNINLNANSILNFEGNNTLSGNGAITLGNTGSSNRIGIDNSGTLTVDSNVLIHGQNGSIGQPIYIGGGSTLVNKGTVSADVAGGLITIVANTVTNNGTLSATAGTLSLNNAINGTGTLLTSGTGQVNVGASSTVGNLVNNGTGASALNLGTSNITVSSDYSNANWGSGNSFSRRANVNGTGQILAAGDVSQTLSGANVTGDNTGNATLTIGNVRVGANNYSYTVGNGGTTGPALRGAVQTSAGGASLTDSRLSGSGVTASNYNAGGPGGSGETRTVTFTASSAGALAPMSGQVLNLTSNFDNVGDQKLNIVLGSGAAAYNAAVGNATPAPVTLANQRVGGAASQVLTISNTAAAGNYSEDLRASISGTSGSATSNGGSINALLAGNSNASAVSVGVDTSTSGAKTGTVTLAYQTTGTVNGVSNNLGTASAGSQTVNVSGNVYQAAAGQLVSAPLNFGTVQVGQVVTQNLVVRNTATGAAGFVEDLNASFGSSSGTGAGLISGSGSLNGVRAGNNSNAGNGTMAVSVNTSAAGTVNGSIAVNYFTAGAVNGVNNGLGTASVGSEAYGVQGQINATANVINQASPLVNNPSINLGAVRVGAAAPSGTVSVTNVATVSPQAALNASMGGTTGPAMASGSFNLLNPGATNNGSLVVGLSTATAGNFTGANAGTATINFVSDASNVGGCGSNCQLNLASQTVNVEGKVYTQAVGSASGTSINFGVVRVGDTVSAQNIIINNTAAVTALNDTLQASLSGVGGAFTGNGSTGPISAQAAGLFAVGLDTSTAGIFSGAGTVGFASHNADMADVSAGANAAVTLSAQVNNLANGEFDQTGGSGSLSHTGTTYVLDLGNVLLGSSVGAQLQMVNAVAGPADDLSGSFDLSAADDFSLSGWNPLAFLAAGQAGGALNINWLAAALGQFSDTITFFGLGTNASDTAGLAQQRQLIIRANVISGGTGGNVPEPGTLALLLGAAAAGWAVRAGRKAVAA